MKTESGIRPYLVFSDLLDQQKSFRSSNRERSQQKCVQKSEYQDVGADSNTKQQDGRETEQPVCLNLTYAVFKIVPHVP
ncbi:MAG: hypothetical protein AUH13_10905 [Acidobacteria bacterium 13_2_20CM_58_27]|nr:MAG: hypothetical protein AUH13_10905 [Acidobacteria bacterium 13_2_20CM_58_27]